MKHKRETYLENEQNISKSNKENSSNDLEEYISYSYILIWLATIFYINNGHEVAH